MGSTRVYSMACRVCDTGAHEFCIGANPVGRCCCISRDRKAVRVSPVHSTWR